MARNPGLNLAYTDGVQRELHALGRTPGTTYYVDSGHASASNNNAGTSWDRPCATIDGGNNKCTASQGDKVIIAARHAENITAADSIDMDVAGVEFIGLRNGNQMPTISSTAAEGSITVAAANVTIRNIKMQANFTGGTTAGITIAAAGDGCTLDGIVMRDTANTKEHLLHLTVATTVDDLTIQNCDFVHLSGGSATNSILFAGTSTYLRIINTFIFADCTDSVVDHLVGAATDAYIDGLTVYNEDDQTAGYVLDFHASSTGIVTNCRGAYNKIDAEMTKGAAMWWIENYFSNTIAQSGLLEPSTAHAIP